jgi:hypothetical protein
MRRRLVLAAVGTVLFGLYLVTVLYGEMLVSMKALPDWWMRLFASQRTGVLVWWLLSKGAMLLLVSIPFALVIRRLYPLYAVPVALGLTVLVWAALALFPYLAGILRPDSFYVLAWLLGYSLTLLGILPALVWLMTFLPSNNRWRGP